MSSNKITLTVTIATNEKSLAVFTQVNGKPANPMELIAAEIMRSAIDAGRERLAKFMESRGSRTESFDGPVAAIQMAQHHPQHLDPAAAKPSAPGPN